MRHRQLAVETFLSARRRPDGRGTPGRRGEETRADVMIGRACGDECDAGQRMTGLPEWRHARCAKPPSKFLIALGRNNSTNTIKGPTHVRPSVLQNTANSGLNLCDIPRRRCRHWSSAPRRPAAPPTHGAPGLAGFQPRAFWASRRLARSASLTARWMRRLGMSISMTPSTRPIAPPQAASGEAWPMDRPEVPPEKRPSVRSAQPCRRPLRLQVAGRIEHFLHARAALRPFVADHHHVAGDDLVRGCPRRRLPGSRRPAGR